MKKVLNQIKYGNESVSGALLIFLIIFAFGSTPISFADPEPDFNNISVDDAYHMITTGNTSNILILDVRNQCEFDKGHIYNALLIPLFGLENKTSPFFWLENKTAILQEHINDPIIVYCAGGSRSEQACQILVNQGFTDVYNMLGGITEWMEEDYPIYTSYHYVTVNPPEHGNKLQIDIEPTLLRLSNCSCSSSCQSCPSNTTTNTTETIIEESENHTVVIVTFENNDTTSSYTFEKNILWHYNEIKGGSNRTAIFSSNLVTSEENETIQYNSLKYTVQNQDYNLSLFSIIEPLDFETYNSSFTLVNYEPTGKTDILTVENVDFNMTLSLSELISGLSDVAKELGKDYGKSEDENLKVFKNRYYTIAKELKTLSNLVANEISDFDKNIVSNSATILDDDFWCSVCTTGCSYGISIGWILICGCTGGLACTICTFIMGPGQYLKSLGCYIICHDYYDCDSLGTPSFGYVSSITTYSTSGTGQVLLPTFLMGAGPNNYYARLICPSNGDTATIVGQLSITGVHGYISIYGATQPYNSSDLYVYVSYDNANWNYIGSTTVTSSTPHWINFGYTSTCFTYIAVVGYNTGNGVDLNLDCVRVVP